MTNNADRKTAGSSESESASMFDFDLSEVFQRAPDNDLHLVTTWSSFTRSNRSISKEANNMSYKTLPLLFINLGGEMIYILDQRLRAQNIPNEKSRKGEWFPLPVLRNFNVSCFYLTFLSYQSLFVFFAFFLPLNTSLLCKPLSSEWFVISLSIERVFSLRSGGRLFTPMK